MAQKALDIVVVQESSTLGDIDKNSKKISRYVSLHPNADLIVFPECFLTGYPLQDLVLRPGFLARVDSEIEVIREAVISAGGPAILFGAPLSGADLPINAALLIEPSGAKRIIAKTELPNNDVFDERRVFSTSDTPPKPLMFRGFRLGIMICEDMWHGRVANALSGELAEILIVLNGSPYQRGKQEHRRMLAATRSRETGLPLVYVNMVGGQDELVFDGGSFAHDPRKGGFWGIGAMNIGTMKIRVTSGQNGMPAEISPIGNVGNDPYPEDYILTDYMACVIGLQDYMRKTNAGRAFVGVSGGLDSALVLTMAVDALGPQSVVGVMMPSKHTGRESLDLAKELMERLMVKHITIPIVDTVASIDKSLMPGIDEIAEKFHLTPKMDVTRENYQSRTRGLYLMGLTNAIGGRVLSTGNKSEMSVGYATIYGDMNGGFNPIKSVYKSDAFKMCWLRNTLDRLPGLGTISPNPIPERIITRPPSAELAEGQTDEASLGNYDLLDLVLKTMIEEREGVLQVSRVIEAKYSIEEIARLTGGKTAIEYAKKIAWLVRTAQFKRDQAPHGVKLNATDFGLGWRYPIAGSYEL